MTIPILKYPKLQLLIEDISFVVFFFFLLSVIIPSFLVFGDTQYYMLLGLFITLVLIISFLRFKKQEQLGDFLLTHDAFNIKLFSRLDTLSIKDFTKISVDLVSYGGRMGGIKSLIPDDGTNNTISFIYQGNRFEYKFLIYSRAEFILAKSMLKRNAENHNHLKVKDAIVSE